MSGEPVDCPCGHIAVYDRQAGGWLCGMCGRVLSLSGFVMRIEERSQPKKRARAVAAPLVRRRENLRKIAAIEEQLEQLDAIADELPLSRALAAARSLVGKLHRAASA